MGDRANVAVKQDGKNELIYLYTHWGGSELPFDVQRALRKRWRWSDGAYLTRIIFDAMTVGSHDEETGFGIATYRCDNEHPIIVVDPERRLVGFSVEGEEPSCYESWTFEKFITLTQAQIEVAYKRG